VRRRAGVRLWPPLWLVASPDTGELRPWAAAWFALLRRARARSWGDRIADRLADLIVETDWPSATFVALLAWWAATEDQPKPTSVDELGHLDSPASVSDPLAEIEPGRSESPARVPQPTEAFTSSSRPTIDLNTASADELGQLPGIGPKRTAAIVAYRAEHGPFASIEELIHVPGIGRKTVEKIATAQ